MSREKAVQAAQEEFWRLDAAYIEDGRPLDDHVVEAAIAAYEREMASDCRQEKEKEESPSRQKPDDAFYVSDEDVERAIEAFYADDNVTENESMRAALGAVRPGREEGK